MVLALPELLPQIPLGDPVKSIVVDSIEADRYSLLKVPHVLTTDTYLLFPPTIFICSSMKDRWVYIGTYVYICPYYIGIRAARGGGEKGNRKNQVIGNF